MKKIGVEMAGFITFSEMEEILGLELVISVGLAKEFELE